MIYQRQVPEVTFKNRKLLGELRQARTVVLEAIKALMKGQTSPGR